MVGFSKNDDISCTILYTVQDLLHFRFREKRARTKHMITEEYMMALARYCSLGVPEKSHVCHPDKIITSPHVESSMWNNCDKYSARECSC